VLEDLKAQFPSLVVFDHHMPMKPELEGLDYCFYSEDHSSCVQVWEALCGDLPVPMILRYVEDRDLWKFELPESKAINAYIATMPNDFIQWLDFNIQVAHLAGEAVVKIQDKQIKSRLKDVKLIGFSTASMSFDLGSGVFDYTIPIVNASENISELGEAMNEAYPDAPFSISYCDRADGKRSYSLRSRNGFDVSVVAKAFGGGGHKGAAGFALDAPEVFPS
jgi:oligoribonuclease NrnB/cAMP/cGMP phosphodiesterase (DHH superfamily)